MRSPIEVYAWWRSAQRRRTPMRLKAIDSSCFRRSQLTKKVDHQKVKRRTIVSSQRFRRLETRTGHHCPETAWWRPSLAGAPAQLVREGELMPAVEGTQVTCINPNLANLGGYCIALDARHGLF